VRVATSNLEKVIFDAARSKISYKAAVINRRKEIIKCTENFAIHNAFLVNQGIKVAEECCPVASGMFQKASALILPKKSPEKSPENAPKRIVPKFMSTSERLKKLKPKKPVKLTKQEEDLMTKYLTPKPKVEKVEPKIELSEQNVEKSEPKAENIEVKVENSAPKSEIFEGKAENSAPKSEIFEGKPENSAPKSENFEEKAENLDSDVKSEQAEASENKNPDSDDEKLTIDENPFEKVRIKLALGKSKSTNDRMDRLRRLNALANGGQKRKADDSNIDQNLSKKLKISDDAKKVVRFGQIDEKADGAAGAPGRPKEYVPNELESCKNLVLKIISPYFKAGRFSDKKFFKELAKRVTKTLVSVSCLDLLILPRTLILHAILIRIAEVICP